MPTRKQTPDILTEILEGISAVQEAQAVQTATGKTRPKSGSKNTTSKPAPKKPAQETTTQLVKYEYVLVTFQNYKGWRPRFIDGKEVANWMRGSLIHEYLDELGEEGWELAAASGGECMYGSADRHQLFFTRVKKN